MLKAVHYRKAGQIGLARIYDSGVAFELSELYEQHVHDNNSAIEFSKGLIDFMLLSVYGMYTPNSTGGFRGWLQGQELLRTLIKMQADEVFKHMVAQASQTPPPNEVN